MNKPTKKQGILIAGILVILGCAVGWALMSDGDKNNVVKSGAVVVNNVKPVIEKAIEDQNQEEKQEKEQKEKANQQEDSQKEVIQSIAPEPEIPQEETVQAPPVQEPSESVDNGNKNNGNHEGMMWLPGFGWVKDEGGGGEGSVSEGMDPNGNQIGEMD